MNKFMFSGNLGKDADLTFIAGSGKAILKFSVGVARGFKREDGTDWFNCALFGDRAEKLSPYLVKGTKVIVEGTVRNNSYEKDGIKKYSTEVLVGNVEMLGSKNESSTEYQGHETDRHENEGMQEVNGDDIPF